MKGDFSRDTFDAANHFSRVLIQQGRVQLDADANEQAAILLHYLQTLAADLIGPHGGPADGSGFGIVDESKLSRAEQERLKSVGVLPLQAWDFLIGPGRYYVDGVLCESEQHVSYRTQPDYPLAADNDQPRPSGTLLVYLDVWERHLSYQEVEDAEGRVISPREVALGGPDTASRAQVVWQVKLRKPSDAFIANPKDYNRFLKELGPEEQPGSGLLKARAIKPGRTAEDPCTIPPDARYRGPENQLYRVEVHMGTAEARAAGLAAPTFKWSRENGSVIFPIRRMGADRVYLESLGRDGRLGLQPGDWVEIVDDDYSLHSRAEPLLQVDEVDYDETAVTLKGTLGTVGGDPSRHPLLRRWDQRDGDASNPGRYGVPIVEGVDERQWIELEDGVQIQFQPGRTYRTGDYWLIPARTATGDVEWPGGPGAPLALGPRGIVHHYAPLRLIAFDANGKVTIGDDSKNNLRRVFAALAK